MYRRGVYQRCENCHLGATRRGNNANAEDSYPKETQNTSIEGVGRG